MPAMGGGMIILAGIAVLLAGMLAVIRMSRQSRQEFFSVWRNAVLFFIVASILFYALFQLRVGKDFLTLFLEQFNRNLEQSITLYKQLGWPEAEIERAAKLLRWIFLRGIGAIGVGLGIIVAGLLMALEPQLPPRRLVEGKPMPPFATWRLPEFLVWVLIPSLLGMALRSRLPESLALVAWNVLLVMAFLYFIAGLAVMASWIQSRQLERFQAAFLLLVFIMPGVAMTLTLLGVLDTWMDWRKRFNNQNAQQDR
jgi:uncharacterized protein YybS (DUF2232 family)